MQNIGHAHDGLELFFLEEGQAIVYVGDQEEYVSAGEAVILRASLPHAGQALTPLAVRTVLRFDPDLIPISEPGHFIQHLLHQREVVRFALPVATRIRISWAYEQIEGSLTGKIEWAPIDALLGLILADLHYCVQRVGHPNLSMITPVDSFASEKAFKKPPMPPDIKAFGALSAPFVGCFMCPQVRTSLDKGDGSTISKFSHEYLLCVGNRDTWRIP